MFTSFYRDIDPKHLYFKLNSALQICDIEAQGPGLKFAGIYAIFKNETCYYVGQSQNLASRISQHITGKYETADQIKIFMPYHHGFHNFYERAKETRKEILEHNELVLMQIFKPIENLITPPSDYNLSDREKFRGFIDYEENTSDCCIYLDKRMISVCEDTMPDVFGAPGTKDCFNFACISAEDYGAEKVIQEVYNGKS